MSLLNLPLHLVRMKDELKDLQDRVAKLEVFTAGETFKGLTIHRQELLHNQHKAMQVYLSTLSTRYLLELRDLDPA